ncbi:MAG: DUF6776 family protein [Gammaproteobacteria bacterium]
MKLVVTHHRPWRKALVTLAMLLGVALAVAVAMDYGHWKSIAGAMVSTGEKRTLLKEVVELRRNNEALRDQVAALKRSEAVHEQARKGNHAEMVALRATIAELTGEVEFFRDVVGATAVASGPRVRGIRIRPLAGDGRFGYKLVMTHVNKDSRIAEGSLDVDIRGEVGGERRELGFAEVAESGPSDLAFKFKHFHLFEGTLRMPPGFEPRQIEIAVRERARRTGAHTQTYDWAAVLN